mmetsp:Transcript_33790/g.82398  ORF Transcript_33790/g.82398 Transcript_33790/m.82398 type:complete len:90 (+) Transcript_33790:841-1110(+)
MGQGRHARRIFGACRLKSGRRFSRPSCLSIVSSQARNFYPKNAAENNGMPANFASTCEAGARALNEAGAENIIYTVAQAASKNAVRCGR